MILLLDIGNTRIKWAQWLDGRLTPQQALTHRGVDPDEWMKQLFRERFRPARLLVANVAGPDMHASIAREAQRLWQIKPEFATTAAFAAGVTHSYSDVSAHGVDRWLATIAAHHLSKQGLSKDGHAQGAACVIDAGTAVTVDGVDAKGLHLGGLIVPGVQMMIDSLLEKTGDIARQAQKLSNTASGDVSGRKNLLATGTAQAVAGGALLAVAAAADRSIAEIARLTQVPPKVFLTGGDAERVARAMQTPAGIVPNLVLQGLAILAR